MKGTVFITGADKGLGFSLVNKFLNERYRVFAGRFGRPGPLDRLARRFPAKLTVIPQDVAAMASVRRSAGKTARLTAELDILINNAGITFPQTKLPLPETDLADGHLQAIMEVNAFGPLRVTRQFLPLLEKGGGKCIVNISSEAGSIAACCRESWFGYCMSKTALNAQSQILQRYLGPRGFKVLAVHPGWLQTDMGGRDATVDPDVSAAGIFKLATRRWPPGAPVYMDYTGAPLPW
jgi:NAD(P)-dependent dehydrogenase (short-subunit alcohol dehydrogenase family)